MDDVELNQETRRGQRPARMVGYTSLDQTARFGMDACLGALTVRQWRRRT